MKPNGCIGISDAKDGFTRMELIASVAALLLCGVVVLPLLANTGSRSEQVSCLNSLRQIGIAFQSWGSDHEDRRPWYVPVNEGGTHSHPLRDNIFIQFTPLSNYLSAACLMDPAELSRTKRRAHNWSQEPGGLQNFFNNSVSYMIGPDTFISETHVILAADRNPRFTGTGSCASGGGLVVSNLDFPYAGAWVEGNHGTAGNVLMNDGRVEFTDSRRLREIMWEIMRSTPDAGGSEHMLLP
jgi:hypothetical protein